jgi:two-component system sensor histidine kinase DctS
MPDHREIHQFGWRMLATIVVGSALVWLSDMAEQVGLVNGLTESVLKSVFWGGAMGVLIYFGRRAELPLQAMIALVLCVVFTLGEFALSLMEDTLPNETLLVGRHGELHETARKTISAGWACSVGFLFYALLRSHGEQTRALSATVANLEHEVQRRMDSERAAQESERQLRLVTDGMPAHVAYVDADKHIQFVNKPYQQFKGLPLEAIVERSLCEVIGEDRYQAIEPHIERVLAGEPVTFEWTHHYPRHGKQTFTSSFIPDRDASGKVVGYYAVTIDVTQLRASEEQLQQLRDELVHAGRLSTMGEMAVGIAHELNQPLAAIASYCFACRQLLEQTDPGDEQLRRLLEKLEEQALRAGRIIRHVRVMTRKSATQRVAADVNRLVRDVVELMEAELRQQQIQLVLRLGDELPGVVVDVVQIQQVLLNLVQNAVDAMRHTEPSRRQLEVSTFLRGDDRVEVVVSDSGCGVSAEQERQLFAPFFTTKSNGTGMGLAISRSIVETHDGRIWVKRNRGGGVAICFTLALRNESCVAG